MSGASIETTLKFWASSLRDVKARIRPLFTQERVASSARLFLDGLWGDERRKTSWMRAEAAGDPGPWRHQSPPAAAQGYRTPHGKDPQPRADHAHSARPFPCPPDAAAGTRPHGTSAAPHTSGRSR
jgi:hypothetical protein